MTNNIEFLTIPQTAKLGILSEFRIRELIRQNELPVFKAGTRNYINKQVFLDYVETKSGGNETALTANGAAKL